MQNFFWMQKICHSSMTNLNVSNPIVHLASAPSENPCVWVGAAIQLLWLGHELTLCQNHLFLNFHNSFTNEKNLGAQLHTQTRIVTCTWTQGLCWLNILATCWRASSHSSEPWRIVVSYWHTKANGTSFEH